jgi:hypothetical protein
VKVVKAGGERRAGSYLEPAITVGFHRKESPYWIAMHAHRSHLIALCASFPHPCFLHSHSLAWCPPVLYVCLLALLPPRVQKVVDLAGAEGTLLKMILREHPGGWVGRAGQEERVGGLWHCKWYPFPGMMDLCACQS